MKPSFTVLDALRNLHRLDGSLLESFMVRHSNGMHVLAGSASPFMPETASSEFARLFDLLVNQYQFVIVDASSRLDASVRMVCDLSDLVLLIAHTDVASLWSAARVNQVLSDMGNSERVRLILNRFRKIPGFSESDVEAATGARVFYKLPNHYLAVSSAIDRGVPVTTQNHTEIAKSFVTLAAALTEAEENRRRSWSLFKSV
jgi:Flp pilus assembly CpaE family ATPase